ncbi:DNA adenine methylase [Numidum massiliense]|uniref:DNA adenine methylase n=1 Tax=Numidum massiliense TaxID=1522315 RepID=UPI00093D90B9|nr:Dam family site-specific DNA-(adenine-N6)-methyltransferase [Numidum massiliense]
MRPFLKYRGGKMRDIPFFADYFPSASDYTRYVEPFFGGGAVFFHLEPRRALLNDINAKLMRAYRQVRDRYGRVRRELDELQATYERNHRTFLERKKVAHSEVRVPNPNECLYYRMREEFNCPSGQYLEATVYYFINKTAYSGMIRYNKKGEYNVPYGHYNRFNANVLTRQHSELLRSAHICTTDYGRILRETNDNDFIFLDPPYDCVFTDYGNLRFSGDFAEAEHRRLAADFKNLSGKALMVISKTPFIEALYRPYIVDVYDKHYTVNIRNRFKSEAQHAVISNYHRTHVRIGPLHNCQKGKAIL